VCSRGGEMHVVDAQIVSGVTSLDDVHERKRGYYSNNANLKRVEVCRGQGAIFILYLVLAWDMVVPVR